MPLASTIPFRVLQIILTEAQMAYSHVDEGHAQTQILHHPVKEDAW